MVLGKPARGRVGVWGLLRGSRSVLWGQAYGQEDDDPLCTGCQDVAEQ